MTPVIDITPETQAIVEKSEGLANQLQAFAITTQTDYTQAGEYLKSVKSATKQLDDLRISMTKPLDESKKRIMDFFRKPLDILSRAEATLKRGMLGFQQEQEAKRKAEEARLAELQRKEAEKLAKRAEKAEDKGNIARAEELRQQSQDVASITPIVAPTIQKVEGATTKKVWKFEVIDERAIPREYLIPDLVKIGKMVRAGGDTLQIPGIKIYSEETIAVRA